MTATSRRRARKNPLDDFTRDELVALVERMIARDPDLAALLEHPRPGRKEKVDEARIRAQVRGLCDGIRFDDWRANSDVTAHAVRGDMGRGRQAGDRASVRRARLPAIGAMRPAARGSATPSGR